MQQKRYKVVLMIIITVGLFLLVFQLPEVAAQFQLPQGWVDQQVVSRTLQRVNDLNAYQDTLGRIHVTWSEHNDAYPYNRRIYDARAGVTPVEIASGDGYLFLNAVANPQGGAWIGWKVNHPVYVYALYAQRIDNDGRQLTTPLLFTEGLNAIFHTFVSDNNGNLYVFFSATTVGGYSLYLYATKITPSGTISWRRQLIQDSDFSAITATRNNDGTFNIVYSNIYSYKIKLLKVDADGSIQGQPVQILAGVSPTRLSSVLGPNDYIYVGYDSSYLLKIDVRKQMLAGSLQMLSNAGRSGSKPVMTIDQYGYLHAFVSDAGQTVGDINIYYQKYDTSRTLRRVASILLLSDTEPFYELLRYSNSIVWDGQNVHAAVVDTVSSGVVISEVKSQPWMQFSLQRGQVGRINGGIPSRAGESWQAALSLTADRGIPIPGGRFPLDPDPLFFITASLPGLGGLLDTSGRFSGQLFTIPEGLPQFSVYGAFLSYDTNRVTFVSQAFAGMIQ